jgi:PAS domain S-box-containing protein
MNNKFFSKVVISNIIVVGFVIATFFIIYRVLNNDLNKIIYQKQQISSFSSEINVVSENLQLSFNLKDDSFLSKAAIASNKTYNRLSYLKDAGFDVDTIQNLYVEFFKHAVETTSILLENRLQEARKAHLISEEKHHKLRAEVKKLNETLNEKQAKTIENIVIWMVISSGLLALIMIGNMLYLRKSFLLLQTQQNELTDLKLNAVKKEQELVMDRATMIDAIGDGIYGIDEKGFCTFINKAGLNILKYDKDIILNTHQHHLFHHHKIDGNVYPEEECPIYKTLRDKKTRQATEHFITQEGEFIPVSLTVAPIGSKGAVVAFKDITEAKRYEELLEKNVQEKTKELQELNDSLEERISVEVLKNKEQLSTLEQQSRLAALGEMIGNIAHQWRQPLSVITVAATGMKLHKDVGNLSDERINDAVNNINESAQYLSKTIDTFRNFVKENKELKRVVIQNCIDSALTIVKAALKNNNIELINTIDYSNPIHVTMLEGEFSQVIINIVNNSKDILLQKKIEDPWVKLELTKGDNKEIVILSIEDNGGGIPENVMPRIFDPYYTTKHQSQGTGLGLHMSYRIITESLHGKLYAKNTKEGAKFFIEIPLDTP